MSLEQAHQKMSQMPAWVADMKNRGTIRIGDYADIMVYNMDELGFLYDKPSSPPTSPAARSAWSRCPPASGNILVNGTLTFQENECTNALPGKLLRSYEQVG